MNYAILQVSLGHYLNLWHIMVDKAGSVFPFRGKKKEKPLEWRKIIFFLLAFSFENLQVVNLTCVVSPSELTVQKCPLP